MSKKVRVNVTVDKETLDKAKKKLDLFGGKLSTLFNAYLADFVDSIDKRYDENYKNFNDRLKDVEKELEKLQSEINKRRSALN